MKIGLLWHSLASGNLGVRALTVANMAIVSDVARANGIVPEFVIFGMGEKDMDGAGSADLPRFIFTTRSILSPGGYWRAVRDIDAIVDIGAGDSFAEIYGPKRFAFLWLSKAIAIARGVPLLLAPQTIGPFEKPVYRRLTSAVMRRSVAVIARDDRSLAAARAIAPDAHVSVSVDVAFRLPYDSQAHLRGGARRRIGVNVSGLLFHEAETGRNRFGLSYDYAAYTRSLLAELSARDDVEIYLIPHATSSGDPGDDDGQIAERMAKEFPKAVRVPDFASASDAKSFISGLDFLVAARMHACIGAYSSGTPVLPVAYSRKFSGLFDAVHYDHVLPFQGIDLQQALDATRTAIDAAPALARQIAIGMDGVEAQLDVYREELRRLFSIAGSRSPER